MKRRYPCPEKKTFSTLKLTGRKCTEKHAEIKTNLIFSFLYVQTYTFINKIMWKKERNLNNLTFQFLIIYYLCSRFLKTDKEYVNTETDNRGDRQSCQRS